MERIKQHWGGLTSSEAFIKLREYVFIAVGLIPYGLAVNQILIPHTIVSGGLTGVSELIYFSTQGVIDNFPGATQPGIPVWFSTITINAILLLIALRDLGWRFCLRTLYGAGCLAFWLKVLPITATPLLSDPFMAIMAGGVLCGIGLGIAFLNNGNSGGTDIIVMIVNKHWHLPMGRILLYCDIVIISCAFFLPQVQESANPVEKVIYGLVFSVILALTVDWVMAKRKQSVQFMIFSFKHQEIADAINKDARRGVTVLDGTGWYSKQSIKVITVLAKKSESNEIFDLVHRIDPNAFVSQSDVRGVYGQGFDSILKR